MRRILQRFVLVTFWIGFLSLWYRVLAAASWTETARIWSYVVAFGAIYALLLWWWVRHNQRIWQRKGPRLNVRRVDEDWSKDYLGRPVVAKDAAVWAASLIRVELREGNKRYQRLPISAELDRDGVCNEKATVNVC